MCNVINIYNVRNIYNYSLFLFGCYGMYSLTGLLSTKIVSTWIEFMKYTTSANCLSVLLLALKTKDFIFTIALYFIFIARLFLYSLLYYNGHSGNCTDRSCSKPRFCEKNPPKNKQKMLFGGFYDIWIMKTVSLSLNQCVFL